MTDFYVYDLSEHCGWDFQETGRIGGVDDLADYWQKPGHWAFLIRADERLAGFACVRRLRENPTPLYDVGEFFVVRKYRRRGVGRHVARELFTRFAGEWQVRELIDNAPATRFWRRVIGEITAGRFAEATEQTDDGPQVVQRFNT